MPDGSGDGGSAGVILKPVLGCGNITTNFDFTAVIDRADQSNRI